MPLALLRATTDALVPAARFGRWVIFFVPVRIDIRLAGLIAAALAAPGAVWNWAIKRVKMLV